MNYGMYIAASGMSAQMARQDVLSNNLANVGTTGFKPDILAIRGREPARIEDRLPTLPSNALLERLGGGVMPTPTRVNLSQAPLERTGRPLDLGIEGEGFLVVRAGPGAEGIRYTRDGRLALAPDGTLVTASEGNPVLGLNDETIQIDPRQPLRIDADGSVRQGDTEVGRLALVSPAEPDRLIKAGNGQLRPAPGSSAERSAATGRVLQEHLESSGTNSINAMIAVTSASRAVDSNATIIGYINEMMGRAINTLGKVN